MSIQRTTRHPARLLFNTTLSYLTRLFQRNPPPPTFRKTSVPLSTLARPTGIRKRQTTPPRRTLPLCRNTKDYALRLEELVYGGFCLKKLMDDKEALQSQIEEVIAKRPDPFPSLPPSVLMPNLTKGFTSKRAMIANSRRVMAAMQNRKGLGMLLVEQGLLEREVKGELNFLTGRTDNVCESLEAFPFRLPGVLTEGLERYGNARDSFLRARATLDGDDLEKINASLVWAGEKEGGKGWVATRTRVRRLEWRRGEILKGERVLGVCRAGMTREVRRLCEVVVPGVLREEGKLGEALGRVMGELGEGRRVVAGVGGRGRSIETFWDSR